MKTRGTGLLAIWADMPEVKADGYAAWFREERRGRLGEVPGVLSGGLFRAIAGAPGYLELWELEDPGVLETEAYRSLRYAPTEREKASAPAYVGTNYMANGYRQIFPYRTSPGEGAVEMPSCIVTGRMNIAGAMEEEYNAWYNTAYIPPYMKVPGVLGCRRFEAVNCQPKYLTFYEFEHPEVRNSPEWKQAQASNPWTSRVRPLLHDQGSPAIYQRIDPA